MWNVRGTSTAMPNWLAHGATYALRIYAMRADWDGLTHSNQNVTPHSAIVTFTLPSCNQPATTTTTTTTTVAPTTYSVTYNGNTNSSGSVPVDATAYTSGATVTVAGNTGTLAKTGYTFNGWCTTQPAAGAACTGTSRAAASTFTISSDVTLHAVWRISCAAGGVCALGETGPGGGVIFYVHDDADDLFTSTGSSCNTSCAYLEYAADGWNGTADDPGVNWSGNTSQTVAGATGTAIGSGYANTQAIVAQAGGGNTPGRAATLADSYVSGSVNDWHLPSSAELNELCKYVKDGSSGNTSAACSGAYGARSSFFGDINVSHFWSSTQSASASGAIGRSFWTGGTTDWAKMSIQPKVRPIRAVLAPSCANGGTCIVGDTGPGGGTVFYVHSGGGTFACGSALTSTCRYLEAAPADVAGTHAWCSNTSSLLSVTAIDIGAGMANTTTADNTCSSGAIQQAADYTNNGRSDWYLPSRDELNSLYNQRGIISGIASDWYWSSSEFSATHALTQTFADGSRGDANKVDSRRVRPVRAFGGTLGCADGGTCVVGDTGPGGGTVFYVHSGGGTFSCGVALVSTCRYLEVAPADIAGTHAWCSNTSSLLNATYTAIGAGMENTTTADPMCTTDAIQQAADYTNNGRSDWYLPSKDELNELCKYARTQTTGTTSTPCVSSGTLRTGFTAGDYWSSSEILGNIAWQQYFVDGSRSSATKTNSYQVRPIRAFG
jgi:hypothetical protein